MKLSKKRPSRSGVYLVKENGEYTILDLLYNSEYREWWISDYPRCSFSEPYSEKSKILWGIRLE